MRARLQALATVHPGLISPVGILRIFAFSLAISTIFSTKLAHSGDLVGTKVDPDPPPRENVVPKEAKPTWDLDGYYLWLGPTGAASRIEAKWDSTIGADLAFVRVREREALGTIGVSMGASRWTERGGGRVWLDAIAGTRLLRMVGVSAGPILELADLAHPRLGGSIGLWAFVGVTPFVRIGAVDELGAFAEVGIHIALPVFRR